MAVRLRWLRANRSEWTRQKTDLRQERSRGARFALSGRTLIFDYLKNNQDKPLKFNQIILFFKLCASGPGAFGFLR